MLIWKIRIGHLSSFQHMIEGSELSSKLKMKKKLRKPPQLRKQHDNALNF